MRDTASRFFYRRIFWKMFTLGGDGASEATWLEIAKPLNKAVKNSMSDQMNLRKFIESLPVSYSELEPDSSLQLECGLSHHTLSNGQNFYVSYLFDDINNLCRDSVMAVKTKPDEYEIGWYNPSNGIYIKSGIQNISESDTIQIPDYTLDIVLILDKR